MAITPSYEGPYPGAGGLRLFRRAWRPPGAPKAVLVMLHGLGDHAGLHLTPIEYFVTCGLVVHAPDLRGNGRSAGPRGHVTRWVEFREDLRGLLEIARAEDPGRVVFLLGHSMGGLIALDHALQHPEGLRGVIASAPPLGPLGVPPLLLALGRVASRVWPRFSLDTGMDLSGLARDPTVVEEILKDPHFHRRGSARLSTELQRTVDHLQASAPRFRVPLLVLHGTADRLVSPEGSRRFVPRVGCPDRELREYPGGFHALFADGEGDAVLRDVATWIDHRL